MTEERSEERRRLLQSLKADARSDDPTLHAQVAKRVTDAEVLGTLDSEADYANAATFRLRVSQVLEALATNPSPSAHDAFVSLTTDEAFIADDDRTLALVRTSQHIRPPPPPLVDFWDRYCQPEDGFTPTTIKVLLDNGTEPAIGLLEKKFADPAHEDGEKVAWMRMDVLRHRNDVLVLQASQRLLDGELAEPLRPDLVEVLFDYKPEVWYRPAVSASPPELSTASPAALDALHALGIVALTMVRLTDEQRAAVRLRLDQVEKLRGF
ncbi:MAG TPA: hypothetical protein VER11_34765 [Polyangiaceae bacterium]|nr:hypothetical protein [Polyangiaceae bacterium]